MQWGAPIGKHEAITHKLADMGATVYAMEAMTDLASEFSMRKGYDIRLEAAACKEWGTVRGWRIADETMQIRGGRGYETEISLKRPRRKADRRRAHHARLPDQSDLRGLERDHAPFHGA